MLRQLIDQRGPSQVGVFFQRLGDKGPIEIDADRSYHAASTMKVPVMMEAFRRARTSEFSLDRPICVVNSFESVVNAPPYALDIESDSDPDLYKMIGSEVPAEQLVERMITRSSNLATNLLIDHLGVESIQGLMSELSCSDMCVLRGVEDDAAYQAGIFNSTTARSLGKMFLELAEGTFFDRREAEQMLGVLSRQEHRNGIPSGVPNAYRICNKTGWFSNTFHDGGLIELTPKTGFVLVVLSEGADKGAATSFVAAVASLCAKHGMS